MTVQKMPIRTLDLLDLPALYTYRDRAVGFDSTRALTGGNQIGMGWGTYINPSRRIYGAVAEQDGASLMGGVLQNRGEPFAKLLYLAPDSRLDHPELPALLEKLAAEAGTWGVFHVIAEVEESSDALPALRQAGFSVYAWQRMWDVSELAGDPAPVNWERARSIHLPAIQSLYQQIVPPLLQPVEQMPRSAGGYICTEGVRCYISSSTGAYGIVLHPLIHPEATQVSEKLLGLVQGMPERRKRRVYICVRSYQAWLEHLLADLGGKPGPRQAVMVKHLAHLVKEEQPALAKQPAGVRSVQPSRVSRMRGGSGTA
ncbi:MAG: hypothetical protein ACM3QS_10655 [Bacteroidota bacterium]